jgi:ParB family transcriptional regulator, chromosome partitioning protein
MALGNRGFAQGLTEVKPASTTATRLPPRTGILGTRDNRLAELAAGNSVARIHELIDPARCRIWEGHNRDYASLNAQTCADLIESFKAQGRQEIPATVRRIQGDSDHTYEVICGARRHWAVSWMRANNYPEFKFLIEPRELTDEEAFRIADLENRSRRDLSDYERALDYARAIERYYEGSQQRMAERLEVTKSWLSRYLELAKLPAEILRAFGSPHTLGISHGAILAPLLRKSEQREHLLAEARVLDAEQADLSDRGAPAIPPAVVMQRLVAAAKARRASRPLVGLREHVVRTDDGTILARGQRAARGGITINVPAPTKHEQTVLLDAMKDILGQLSSTDRTTS